MTPNDYYVDEFKKHFGYDPCYFPEDTFGKVAEWLRNELKIKMPTDTEAMEAEGDAVMLLVSSGDDEAAKIGKRLGNIMMKDNIDDDVLLSAMEVAAAKLEELEKLRGIFSHWRRRNWI